MPARGIAGALADLIEARLPKSPKLVVARAAELIARAESLGSELPVVHYAAGLMYLRLQRSKDAERLVRRAVELDPAFQPAYAALSSMLSDQGQDQAAARPR